MGDLAAGLAIAAVAVVAAMVAIAVYRAWDLRQHSQERIARRFTDAARRPDETRGSRFAARRRWPALIAGGAVVVILALLGVPIVLVGSLAAVAGIVTWIAEEFVMEQHESRIEAQLADAIDIMVGAVRAGTGPVGALEAALRAGRAPLRPELEQVTGRFKLGDDPQQVLQDLARRVPLETFRLFTFTLAVNWGAGGNIAPALAATARTIRDRIDLARRVRAQAAEGQLSAVGIVAIVSVLGYLFWRADPDRMEAFVRSETGLRAVALVIFLQALGLLWVSRIVKVRF